MYKISGCIQTTVMFISALPADEILITLQFPIEEITFWFLVETVERSISSVLCVWFGEYEYFS